MHISQCLHFFLQLVISGPSSPDLVCTEIPTVLDILLWLATGEALFSHRLSATFAAFLLALYHCLQNYPVPARNPSNCCSKLYSWTNDPFPMNYSFPHVFFLHILDVLQRPLSFGIHSLSQTSPLCELFSLFFYLNVKFSVLLSPVSSHTVDFSDASEQHLTSRTAPVSPAVHSHFFSVFL